MRRCTRHFIEQSPGFVDAFGHWHEARPRGLLAGTASDLVDMLQPHTHRWSSQEPSEVPMLTRQTVWLPLPPEQAKLYRAAEKTGRRLPWRLSRLLEQACAPCYTPNAKTDGALELIRGRRPDSKIVVTSSSRFDLDGLAARLDDEETGHTRLDSNIKSPRARRRRVEQFRDDAGAVALLADYAALNSGLDGLQSADWMIQLGVGLDARSQARMVSRLHRVGNPSQTVRHLMLLTDTQHEHSQLEAKLAPADDAAAVLAGLYP